MDKINIVKNDGRAEPYMFDKLLASITKTGLGVKFAKPVADKISEWIKEEAADGQIKSAIIKDKIIEVLGKNYPVEADTYKSFKKG